MRVKYIAKVKKHFLNPGETYEVEYETEDRYAIRSNTSSETCTFRKKHFIEVKKVIDMKIKCIEVGSWSFITKGKVYDVRKEAIDGYVIYDDRGTYRSYNRNYFEVVKEDNNMNKIIETIDKRFEELYALIEQLKIKQEEIETKAWKPKKGYEYWYITAVNDVDHDSNSDSSIDERIIKAHNAFKTKEEAERKVFERQLFGDLEEFALENNKEEIDWNNREQKKYSIMYNYEQERLEIINISYTRHLGQIYFTSKEIAQKCANKYKDNLIKYYTIKE